MPLVAMTEPSFENAAAITPTVWYFSVRTCLPVSASQRWTGASIPPV